MRRALVIGFTITLALGCHRETAQEKAEAQRDLGRTGTVAEAHKADTDQAEPSVSKGSLLPDMSLDDLYGGSPVTTKSLHGKVALLNVWATWCGPCRAEIPELEAIHKTYRSKGVEVVGVSVDQPDAVEDVKSFVAEQKITYRIVLDARGELASRFETSVIPTTFLVNRKGEVVWMHVGVLEQKDPEFQKQLSAALAS
jgi:cytochrome c biogenesis protein CcmG, thiol:disulfide interchange protein DsbE